MKQELVEKAKKILLDPKVSKNVKEQVFEILEKQRTKATNSAAKSGILDYAKHMYPGYNDPAHIKLIGQNLESLERGEIDRLAIFMPPRHGKSMLCSEFFPAWYLGRNPRNFVIQATYAQELADDFGRKVRNQLKSDDFMRVFEGVGLRDDSSSAKRFHTVHGGTYSAVGAGGAITGRGADLLIIDDPIKGREEAESGLQRRNLIEWYKAVAYTRLQPGGKVILIQTRWHEDDLAGWILENSGENWKVLDLPAINANGDALWPEAYPVAKLEKIKATVGDRVWESLYQQRPTSEQGAILKRDWWRKLDHEPQYDFVVQSYDTAFSTRETADFSARTTWGVFSRVNEKGMIEACIHLIEAWKDRVEYPDLRRIAQEAYWDMKPNLVLVEKRASGQSLLQDLRRAGIPVHEYRPDKDKVSRAHAVAPMLESGLIWITDKEVWVDELLAECAAFPYGKHDDYVDTCTQAWQLIKEQYLVAHPLDPELFEEWDDKPLKTNLIEKRYYS